MKKKSILLLGILISVLITFSFPVKTNAATSKVTANVELGDFKQLVTMKNPLLITDNRVLIPVREIGDLLALEVFWNQQKQTAELYGVGKEIKLTIGSSIAYVNKKKITLDAPAKVVDGNTYIPLRFVAESLNEKVRWNSKNKTLSISSTYAKGKDKNTIFWLNRKSGDLYQANKRNVGSKIGTLEVRVEELRKLEVKELSDSTSWIKIYEAVGTSATVKTLGHVFVKSGKVIKQTNVSFVGHYPDTNIEQSQGNVLLTNGQEAEFRNDKGEVKAKYDFKELLGKDEIYMIEHHTNDFMILREYTTQHLIIYDFKKNNPLYVHEVISLTPFEKKYLEEIAHDRMGDLDPEHIIKFLKLENGNLIFEYKSKETEKTKTYKFKL